MLLGGWLASPPPPTLGGSWKPHYVRVLDDKALAAPAVSLVRRERERHCSRTHGPRTPAPHRQSKWIRHLSLCAVLRLFAKTVGTLTFRLQSRNAFQAREFGRSPRRDYLCSLFRQGAYKVRRFGLEVLPSGRSRSLFSCQCSSEKNTTVPHL